MSEETETHIEQHICQKAPVVDPKINSVLLSTGLRTGNYISKCYRAGLFI